MNTQLKPVNNTFSILDGIAVPAKAAAQMLGVSPRTMANWRAQGKGPDFVRLGVSHSAVVYRVQDPEDWLAAHVVDAKTGKSAPKKPRKRAVKARA